ncbi:MAG: SBBP repeat-containing protein [Chloroflexota bacterium]
MSTNISTLPGSGGRAERERQKVRLSLAVIVAVVATAALPFTLRQALTPQASLTSSPVISNQSLAQPAAISGQALSRQPLAFEPNAGQTDPSVRFLAHAPGGTIFFTRAGVTLSLKSTSGPAPAGEVAADGPVVRIAFVGASAASLATDGPEMPFKVNYFTGNDSANWHTNVPVYGAINYSGLYKGVTLKYEGAQGQLKGTYTVAAGADPGQIRWQYTGTSAAATIPGVDAAGNLLIGGQGASTLLTEQAPVAWQQIGGNRLPVDARYIVTSDGSVSFALGAYNRAEPLIIDPTMTFSTFLGGTGQDQSSGIAVDSSGNMYITGFTNSTNFPTVGPYQPTNHGTPDAFVTKFNANGTVAYSTYLGGASSDNAYSIAVDSAGNAYVAGYSVSADFPTQNAFQATGGGAFLTKFNSTGSALLYSTLLGGNANEYAWGVAVDGAGNAYITGNTGSTNFPMKNAYQATYGGAIDAFLARFDTTLSGNASLIYSTYLGGSSADYAGGNSASTPGHGVAADAAGNAYITGETASANFPTVNAYDPSLNGGTDAWAAKLNTNLVGAPSLIYSTYLGGNACCDYGRDVDIDSAGNAYLTGQTNSADFPTLNSYHSCSATVSSPYVTKLSAAGNTLVYSTCFGANGSGNDIAVDGTGRAHVVGSTNSNTFPQVNGLQTYGGGGDAFALTLNAGGNTLAFSTYLGGGASDVAIGVATDGVDKTYVTGVTNSANFPVQNAYQPACANSCTFSDAFVTVLDDQAPIITPTISPTATNVPISTNTPTNTRTATPTNTPTLTHTSIPGTTNTSTPTRRPTFTTQPTFTAGPTNTASSTPTPGGTTPTPCVPGFSDVAPTDYFYPGVSYLYCHGAISGYPDGTFRPYNNITRGQLIKIVTIAENWVILNPVQPHFNDVAPGSTFYTYIETAVARQAISGYPDGTFRPNNNVTRGQITKIVCIAQRWPLVDPVDPHFIDVGVDDTFYVFIETALSHNILSGYPDGTFRPGNNATRGQLSKIMFNAITQP